jgi:hypothetical protein
VRLVEEDQSIFEVLGDLEREKMVELVVGPNFEFLTKQVNQWVNK